ncbi:CatB-related O-acetyltransferase [Methylobacterium sp. 1973]|uniref:CatB-related O-acetyltransferase n=1 Tax=Methylobacterium sp. 1973 TaxID=3156421 RepID=UPI003394F1E9
MKFNMIIAAWGSDYVDCLRSITLPSLSIGNLDKGDIELYTWKALVFTPKINNEIIAESFQKNLPFFNVEFLDFDPSITDNPYQSMAAAHYQGALRTSQEGAWAIIIPPDGVFSENALSTIAKIRRSGKRAIMINGPRLSREKSFDDLKYKYKSTFSLTGRQLAEYLRENIHPEWMRYHWNSDDFSTQPFALMWDAPDGWLCRNFHLLPLAFDLTNRQALEYLNKDTVDGDFIGRAFGVWDDIHVISDSDELLLCTLTTADVSYSDHSEARASASIIGQTAYGSANINPLHRWLLTKATKIHSEDLNAEWKIIEEMSGHIVFDILSKTSDDVDQANRIDTTYNPSASTELKFEALAAVYKPQSGLDKYNNFFEEGVEITFGAEIQTNCTVGAYTQINGATLYPNTRVGRFCSIARNAAIGASDHPIAGLTTSIQFSSIAQQLSCPGADIGNDVWVGAGAVIMAGVRVGHGAIVGAGAIVTKDVRPYSIVLGQPAREIKRRFSDDICHALLVSRWWEVPFHLMRHNPFEDVITAIRQITAIRKRAGDIEPEAIAYLEDWLSKLVPR